MCESLLGIAGGLYVNCALVIEPEGIDRQEAVPSHLRTVLLMINHPQAAIGTLDNTMMTRPEDAVSLFGDWITGVFGERACR